VARHAHPPSASSRQPDRHPATTPIHLRFILPHNPVPASRIFRLIAPALIPRYRTSSTPPPHDPQPLALLSLIYIKQSQPHSISHPNSASRAEPPLTAPRHTTSLLPPRFGPSWRVAGTSSRAGVSHSLPLTRPLCGTIRTALTADPKMPWPSRHHWAQSRLGSNSCTLPYRQPERLPCRTSLPRVAAGASSPPGAHRTSERPCHHALTSLRVVARPKGVPARWALEPRRV